MIRVFRYRIYPTKRQIGVLENQLAICAELYNAALQERRDAWKYQRKSISYFDQTKELIGVKEIREDVATVNCKVLDNTLKRVDWAFASFFRRLKRGERPGYPRFHSASRYNSLTFRKVVTALRGSKLRLSKIGEVRIKAHRSIEGKIKTLTIKREAGRWFALFVAECEASPLPFNPSAIGVDMGLKSFAVLSTGRTVENPRWLRNAQAKLRRLQRRVTRRQRGSNRRRKAVLSLQRLHIHVRNQRRDFHHKVSREIINNHGLIAIEKLNIKALARGIVRKGIFDAGWANFLFMLAYKAESAGRVLVRVDSRGTSQTCLCGAKAPKTPKQRLHVCRACGLVGDRDHVSAQIILARSLPSGVNVGDLVPCVA